MKKRYTKAIAELFSSLGGQEVAILETDENGNLLYPEEHQRYINDAIDQVNRTLISTSSYKLGCLRGFVKKEEVDKKERIYIGMYWKRSRYLQVPQKTYIPKFEIEWLKGNWTYARTFYRSSKELGLATADMERMFDIMTEYLPFWRKGMEAFQNPKSKN